MLESLFIKTVLIICIVRSDCADDFRIFCGDLGNDVTDEMLVRVFGKYPSFQKAKVVRDKRTNKTKGFGFVSFKDPQDFIKAMKEMNGKANRVYFLTTVFSYFCGCEARRTTLFSVITLNISSIAFECGSKCRYSSRKYRFIIIMQGVIKIKEILHKERERCRLQVVGYSCNRT